MLSIGGVERKILKEQGKKTKTTSAKPNKNQVAAAAPPVETKLTPPSPTHHQQQHSPISKKTLLTKPKPREGATLTRSFTLELKDWLIPTTYSEYGVKGFDKVDVKRNSEGYIANEASESANILVSDKANNVGSDSAGCHDNVGYEDGTDVNGENASSTDGSASVLVRVNEFKNM